MLNVEKYKEELKALMTKCDDFDAFGGFAIDKQGQPQKCDNINCHDCRFTCNSSCAASRLDWMLSEYVEKTISHKDVTVDTEVYVSDQETFDKCRPAHYAGWDEVLNWAEVFRNGRTKFTNGERSLIAYSYAWLPDGTKIV